jgi:hypothetical protein
MCDSLPRFFRKDTRNAPKEPAGSEATESGIYKRTKKPPAWFLTRAFPLNEIAPDPGRGLCFRRLGQPEEYGFKKSQKRRTLMKRNIARTGVVVVFAAAWVVSMAAPAQAQAWGSCSLYRAAGNWSLTDNGTVVGVGPRIAVGVFTLDDKGNVTNGVATSSLNGTIYDETFSGTMTVSPNCTGTFTANIYISGVLSYTFTVNTAFDQNVSHMRGVFTSAVEQPSGTPLETVIALDADKQ